MERTNWLQMYSIIAMFYGSNVELRELQHISSRVLAKIIQKVKYNDVNGDVHLEFQVWMLGLWCLMPLSMLFKQVWIQDW